MDMKDILRDFYFRILDIGVGEGFSLASAQLKYLVRICFLSRTTNPKIYMEPQNTTDNQNNLEKDQSGIYHISDFKLYYKAIKIRTVW